MSRKIECLACNIDLGEIRDATLRKSVAFLCNVCAGQHTSMKTQIQLLIAQVSTKSKASYGDYMDTFKDVFGDSFFKK